jgi:ATP-dependent helicase/nuclease subunit B
MREMGELALGVRFLIGRAGTGKSRLCAEQIRTELAREPLGGPLLWITPEQGTFTAERMLLTGGGEGRGSFRAQVVSFRRLAVLIAREAGLIGSADGSRGKPLDDLARVVLLEEVVRAHKHELVAFAGVAERAGFVKKLDASLRELRQHGHSGRSLRDLIGSGAADRFGGEMTRRKLRDLAVLLDAWAGVIERADAWDFEKVMHQAAIETEKPGAAPDTLGTGEEPCQVWVDGFSALSALELRLLAALGKRAMHVTISVLADSESPGIKEMREARSAETGVFARTERMYRRMLDEFRRHRIPVEGTATLTDRRRFHSEALRKVEAELFAETLDDRRRKPAAKAATGKVLTTLFDVAEGDDAARGVEIWECSDPETEVRVAAQGIREMVVHGGLRYREVGVIVPELSDYADAVRRVFGEHRIPHFIDERRGIAHHPLVELLRSAVAVVRGRWDRDDVLLYLKTGLAAVAEGEVAFVENYLLAHGIEHGAWDAPWQWLAPEEQEDLQRGAEILQRVNAVRETVQRQLSGAETAAGEGAQLVRWLRGLLENLRVQAAMETWISAARTAGDVELALVHEQAWRGIAEMIGALEKLLVGRTLDWEGFERVLSTALESLTLGLIPPTVDQVLVSSVVRSRVPELKVVMVLGAVEGAFPKVVPEDPILSDAQRELFEAAGAEPIGPGTERTLLDMPFFDYAALTRAGDKLVVSYPLASRAGKAVGRSRYVNRLRELLSGDAGELVERKFDAASRTDIERLSTVDDLLAAAVTWVHDTVQKRAAGKGGDAPESAFAAVYDWVVRTTEPEIAAARELVWPCVRGRTEPALDGALARRFYPPTEDLRMSVSQLEKFAACPMQYFMHYTLGLRPRPVLALDSANMGTLYHRILERVYGRVIAGELAWPVCDARSLRAALEEEVEAAAREVHGEIAEKIAGYEKQRERTKRSLGIVLEADRRRACVGTMRPVGVEVVFGKARGETGLRGGSPRLVKLPVLRVEMADGRHVAVTGKIDRVDAVGPEVSVIDYKSGAKREADLGMVYWGVSLQLPVYGVVMRELAVKTARAAMYVPLGIRRASVKSPAEAPAEGTDAFYQKLQEPRGLVDEAGAGLLDRAVLPAEDRGAKSDWFKIGYKKDGGIPRDSDMLPHADFQLVLDYARWKVGALATQLADGRIAPAPYRAKAGVACDRCDFSSLCPFDRAAGTYREMPRMAREEAVAAMAQALRDAHLPEEPA